jgi:hypothetical protein
MLQALFEGAHDIAVVRFHRLTFLLLFYVVLGFELRAFTLNHSTNPIFVKGFFEIGS